MKKYLGVKMIEAKPMTRGEHSVSKGFDKVLNGEASDAGYQVIYEDGYESWSPKEVFEEAYIEPKSLINIGTIYTKEGSFEGRVVDEAEVLETNCYKLKEFIEDNPIFQTLPEDEKLRMNQQLLAMNYYLSVLIERIGNFK